MKPPAPLPKLSVEQKNTSRVRLACVWLEDALAGNFDNIQYRLAMVHDAGLLEHDEDLSDTLNEILERVDRCEHEIMAVFPLNRQLKSSKNLPPRELTFAEEIEIYREELFWSSRETKSSSERTETGEALITEIHRIFKAVARLVTMLDAADPECEPSKRKRAPSLTANPYLA